MSLTEEFDKFDSMCSEDDERLTSIDYLSYIQALNVYAAERLELDSKSYIILKPVYLHGTKIHSLIFNICTSGRRYSARLVRRVSLGLRERESDRWLDMLKKAMEVALNLPPVGLDPKLEELPTWFESNRNYLRMTFKLNNSILVINSTRIKEASGKKDELLIILHQLKGRGL